MWNKRTSVPSVAPLSAGLRRAGNGQGPTRLPGGAALIGGIAVVGLLVALLSAPAPPPAPGLSDALKPVAMPPTAAPTTPALPHTAPAARAAKPEGSSAASVVGDDLARAPRPAPARKKAARKPKLQPASSPAPKRPAQPAPAPQRAAPATPQRAPTPTRRGGVDAEFGL